MTRQTVPKVCKSKRQNSNIFFFFFLENLQGRDIWHVDVKKQLQLPVALLVIQRKSFWLSTSIGVLIIASNH